MHPESALNSAVKLNLDDGVTDLPLARAIVEALRWRKPSSLEVLALDDYVRGRFEIDSRSLAVCMDGSAASAPARQARR